MQSNLILNSVLENFCVARVKFPSLLGVVTRLSHGLVVFRSLIFLQQRSSVLVSSPADCNGWSKLNLRQLPHCLGSWKSVAFFLSAVKLLCSPACRVHERGCPWLFVDVSGRPFPYSAALSTTDCTVTQPHAMVWDWSLCGTNLVRWTVAMEWKGVLSRQKLLKEGLKVCK
jgi:hypothetical protein